MILKKLSELVKLESNPRTISKVGLEKLTASIRKFGILKGRPLIVSDRTGELVIIAGNQRYDVASKLGIEKVPVEVMSGLTEEEELEITVRDNVSNGMWDMDALNDDWESEALSDWGVDVVLPREKEEKKEGEGGGAPAAVKVKAHTVEITIYDDEENVLHSLTLEKKDAKRLYKYLKANLSAEQMDEPFTSV